MGIDLSIIWFVIIVFATLMYIVMDGFDLGIGILFPAIQDADDRDVMVNSVAPVWDGNETWLVLGGAGLFGAFPLAYSVVLSALYLPLMLMLLFLVWKKHIFEMLPAWTQKWGIRPYWMLFFVCLWMAMPRYLIESSDRVRLVYLDKNGENKHPPLTQYLINTLIPEKEIVNFGIRKIGRAHV